ncbi:RNA polymerase sigma factor [Reichenbachiella versicolor]|uniref:RNA polymerase sigma factor n=1 Tax=Reichenbachiella versicolor TaxID=1821036 RepID=UPI000D6E26E2|nr:sigma-70 family RNA polymerase sigma factor [Reichenbachiella versicolor]
MADQNLSKEIEEIEAAKKDLKHFEPLYNRYFDQIFNFIYRKTDDEDLTADLTSKVFFNAMKSLKTYEFRGFGFGTWLYKIANNEVYGHFRNQKKAYLSLESDKVNSLMTCADLEDGEEKMKLLSKMISSLKDKEVRLLELKYFENKTFEEIAFIMEMNESTVKMRLYRSLNKLKEKFAEYYNRSKQ